MYRAILRFAVAPVALALIVAGFCLTHGASGSDFFMPHAHCYLFNQDLMRLHGGSDMLIGISYVAISATLFWLVLRGRRELPFHWMMIAFAIFIIACGATHFMEVWTLTAMHPLYWLSGWVKLITAIASLTTAVALPPLIPRVLSVIRAARLSAERGEKLERAYHELNVAHARVTQLSQLKTNFFANVSHELRTPLALIFAPVERLLAASNDEDAQRELTVVRRNALLLHKYVNDLLDVSKLEAGRMEIHYSRIDVAVMVRTVAGMFESLVGERGIRVAVQAADVTSAEVDGDKLQRVFMNLISNAVKYAPDASQVRLTLASTDECVELTCEDAGPGVSAELRESIFERFQQGDPDTQRRYGGTGLGLSIVKEFVEMHHGSVFVGESDLGGALFRVRLPRYAPPGAAVDASEWTAVEAALPHLGAAPAIPSASAASDGNETGSGHRPEVLVVEDNRDMREFICRILEPEARIRAVENGRVALEAISQRVPDLVLSDMMMPEMTGDELVAALRREDHLRDLPVVLLTAKAEDEVRINLLREGVQDYVMKPFSVDELRARVRNQLQTKRTRDILRRELDTRSADLASMVGELAAARGAAEKANAAKDDFLAVLSHELRTPLTPALAAASALLGRTESDPAEQREYLGVIRRNIELEARLVDDLLDVTRIARDKLRIHSAPVDILVILRDALAIATPALRAKGIHVVVNLDGPGPMIRGDAARLAQVFSNLLNNAAKFTGEGGRVAVEWRAINDRVRVIVSDNGIGIAPESLPRIFDPFRQGEAATARKFSGLGLGLSIARGLVEAHGGAIDVTSEGLGQGTAVRVELPLLLEEPSSTTTEPPLTAPSAKARSLRVLLVEDHEDTRRILSQLMTRWGHTVATAGSVSEAFDVWSRQTFDLVLSDIGLPDGSGYDVIGHIRATSSIPAVAMSGYGMESDLARTLAAGFNEHIVKPVSAEVLQEALGRLGELVVPVSIEG